MMLYTRWFVLIIGLSFALATEGQTALDVTRWRPSQANTPVWWDNIEGAPFWVRGPKPQFDDAWGMHTISLQPGQTVTLHLPPGRTLRLYHPTRPLAWHDFSLSLDNGSGLRVSQSPQASNDPHSLLMAPTAPGPFEVYISRGPQHQGPLRIALFLSRYDPLRTAPYRDVIALKLPMVQLQTRTYGPPQRFWHLTPYASMRVPIVGPARLAVENRFVYDPTVHHPNQAYRIHARLNKTSLRVLEFVTDVQISQTVFIDDKPQSVSRLEVDYVDIPPGAHTLELQSTAPVYLRLLRQSRADYLLPELNRPLAPKPDAGVTPWLLQTPIWQIAPPQMHHIIASPDSSVIDLEYLATRLWRDNRHRDGGLQAAMLLQGAAASRPHDAPLQRAATRQLGASTTFQHLFPEHKATVQPQAFGWFVTPRLAPLDHHVLPYAAAAQHQEDLMAQLKSGYFVPLPRPPHVHHYVLPPRSAPSELRFVVDTTALTAPQELWLQYDDQPPMHLQLMPPPEGSPPHVLPTPGDIGLTFLRHQNPAFDHGTLGGPFSSRHVAAQFLQTAHTVLPLPAHVQHVNVWQTDDRSEAVSVALQYRVSKPFRLSEHSYLDALQHLGAPSARHALLLDRLMALQYGPATFDSNVQNQRAAIEVVNQWQPLMRLLRARYQRFISDLTPRTPMPDAPPPSDVEARRAQAKQAETTGDWLAALEAWAPLVHTAHETYRREARMGQVNALLHLGRHAVAKRLLRGIMLFDADVHLRLQAFNRLLEIDRQTENADALGTLLAVAAIHQHHPDALRMLVRQFVADGQDRYALQVGLALPASQRLLSSLLQSAWRLGWWRTFDDLLSQLKTAEERHYWLGYRAVHHAAYDTAQHHFSRAGALGQRLVTTIVQAQKIYTALRSQNPAKQEAAVLSWEAWQARHPGPHTWQRGPQMAVDYAGAMSLYNPSLDFHSQWYRSEADRPVQLRFFGPLRLRIAARPLHPKSISSALSRPLDGWITIDHGAQQYLIPIINNLPSSELTTPDNSPWLPGQRLTEEIDFGPGLHTVAIAGRAIPLLIQTEVQRPALPLGILPPLTAPTLYAMLHPQPHEMRTRTHHETYCTNCLYFIDSQPSPASSLGYAALMDISRQRPSPPAQHIHDDLVHLQRRLRGRRPPATPAGTAQPQTSQFVLRQRMARLLWRAEHQPEQYEAALSAAQSLFRSHPDQPHLFSLFAHMTRRSQWQRMTTVQRSAGLHYVEHQGWHPESLVLRANQALLRPVAPGEHIVTGHRRLLVALDNLKPAEFEITIEANELPYGPRKPMTAVYQLDDQAARQLPLTPGQPGRTVRLVVPAGQHALRFYIQEPAVNQFLRLRIVEQRHPAAQPLHHTFERAYHVATHAEPVEILLAGPSWLRIERWHASGTQTHYQTVAPGWQTLKFYPEPGQREALLRLFQRVPAPEPAPFKPQPSLYQPEIIPSPLVHLTPRQRRAFVDLYDVYPLGRQEDGTWTVGTQFVSRRNWQEDVSSNAAERFVEINLTHRYFDAFKDLYFETEAIGRGRTDGGPTLGLQHILAYRPTRQDFALRISGTGFVQLPTRGTNLAGSGTFRLSASRGLALGPEAAHLPSISLFARLLSLNESQAKATEGLIDLDVFSTFKADHRVGLSVADIFTYQPWLDTIWSGEIDIVTNEDFNPLRPDHITLQLEWKQLLGSLQLHTAYRFGYFLADADRRQPIDRHTLLVEANWEHWRPSRQRFEVQLQLRCDLISGDLGFVLGFSWHTGVGRAYRDFRPGVIHFRRLRQYHVPKTRSNRLNYVETS